MLIKKVWIWLILVILCIFVFHTVRATTDKINNLLIVEIYYDTYMYNDEDEYIKLYNPTNEQINLLNWSITDNEGKIKFNVNFTIPPRKSVYITRNATAFIHTNGFLPDFEYKKNTNDTVPDIISSNFVLSNTGDEVILLDDNGDIVDVVIYGDADYVSDGWYGKPANDIYEGRILKRKTNEFTGEYIDTNTARDFDTIREYKPRQTNLGLKRFALNNTTVTMFVSPDSSFSAVSEAISSAKSSISVCMYEFTSIDLYEILLQVAKNNVQIRILLEGNPVGWNFSSSEHAYTERFIAYKLHQAGAKIKFMITPQYEDKRYSYIHAKYIIIDNETLIVLSENFTPSGIPKNNTKGNRGWGIIIKNSSLANYFTEIFNADFSGRYSDIVEFSLNEDIYGPPPEWFEPTNSYMSEKYTSSFSSSVIVTNLMVTPVISPDTSLLEYSSVIGMINSATKSVYVELLDCKPDWNYYTNISENLYLQAVINAGKRGCNVKILLEGKYINSSSEYDDNYDTYLYLYNISKRYPQIEVKLVTINDFSVIHNKGVIVDENKTFISSINWNRNSVCRNRETGLIIENEKITEYFTDVFLYDWYLTDKNISTDDSSITYATPDEDNFYSRIFTWYPVIIIIIVTLIISFVRDTLKRR